jgi:hypothetical protein
MQSRTTSAAGCGFSCVGGRMAAPEAAELCIPSSVAVLPEEIGETDMKTCAIVDLSYYRHGAAPRSDE